MKTLYFKQACTAVLAFFGAGFAMAQQSYCGEVLTHLGLQDPVYVENAVVVTIEKATDTQARITVAPANENKTMALVRVIDASGAKEFTERDGNSIVGTIDYSETPASVVFSNIQWMFEGAPETWMYENINASFTDCVDIADDEEAPADFELVSVTPGAVTVTFVVKATDNSGRVTYTAQVGEETATVTGNSGEETTIVVRGLTAGTEYDYVVTAADAAGNVCDTRFEDKVTTTVAATKVWYGVVEPADYVQGGEIFAPTIVYSITCNPDMTLTMDMTLSSSYKDLQVEVNFGTPDAYLPATADGLHFTVTTTATYDEGQELNAGFFWVKYAEGVSRANFTYVVGSENEPIVPEEDTEAPVINKAEVTSYTHRAVTLMLNVTDNVAANVKVEVSADDFASVLYTEPSVTCGSDVTCEVTGLDAETVYNLKVRATDASQNVSEVVALPQFTTEAAPDLEETVYNGYILPENWNEKGTPDGWDTTFNPTLYYTITTTIDNQLKINVRLNEGCTGLGAEAYVNGVNNPLAAVDNLTFEGTTTATYERGEIVSIYFRFPYASAVSSTQPIEFEVGSSENLPNSVEGVSATAARVYAAAGILYVEGAEAGSAVTVYNVAGQQVAASQTTGSTTSFAIAVHGIYIVKVENTTYKVVL